MSCAIARAMRLRSILAIASLDLLLACGNTSSIPDPVKPVDPSAPVAPPSATTPTLDGTIGIQGFTGAAGLSVYASFPPPPFDTSGPSSSAHCLVRDEPMSGVTPIEPDADLGDIIFDLVTEVGPETLTLSYDRTAKSYAPSDGASTTTKG